MNAFAHRFTVAAGMLAGALAIPAFSPPADTTHQVATGQAALHFSVVNLARVLGVDPESALASRVRRFRSEVERYG